VRKNRKSVSFLFAREQLSRSASREEKTKDRAPFTDKQSESFNAPKTKKKEKKKKQVARADESRPRETPTPNAMNAR
jgi:hypothetical protein